MGGDDITEFLYVLLDKISFPYKDIDLARAADWNMLEDLKARLCTLSEVYIVSTLALHHLIYFLSDGCCFESF